MKKPTIDYCLDYEKENFEDKKKLLPKSWIYHNRKITYESVEWYYRGDTIDDVIEPYVLTLGCSNTFGYGLKKEDTFAYKTGQYLNTQLINNSFPGQSNFGILYFLKKHLSRKIKPKLIIINWSSIHRVPLYDKKNDLISVRLHNVKHWPYWIKTFDEYMKNNKFFFINHFKDVRNTVLLMCELANIKVIEFTNFLNVPDVKQIVDYKLKQKNIDITDVDFLNDYLARDLSHPGILPHQQMFEYIKEKL